MDGPNVNLAFHEDINRQLHTDCGMRLLDVGSCELHKVHNAFQTALTASDWKICDIDALNKRADDLANEAEENSDMKQSNSLFMQSNSLRKSASEKQNQVSSVNQ